MQENSMKYLTLGQFLKRCSEKGDIDSIKNLSIFFGFSKLDEILNNEVKKQSEKQSEKIKFTFTHIERSFKNDE